MKKSLKFVSIICLLVLAVSALSQIIVMAENTPALVIDSSSSSVNAGDTVTLTIRLQDNPGVWSLAFKLPIDSDVFEFVSADTSGSVFAQFGICNYDEAVGAYKFNGYNSNFLDDMTDDGIVVAITLKVRENAESGVYHIVCIPDEKNIINVDAELVKITGSSIAIEVEGIEPEPKPESRIVAADVVLGRTVDVNYYAKLDVMHVGAQMRFTLNGEEIVVDGVPVGDEYVYTLKNIEYSDYDSNIRAELVLDEQVLDVKENYSIKTYCERVMSKSYTDFGISQTKGESLKTLLASLLSYGESVSTSSNAEQIKTALNNYKVALTAYAEK